MLQFGSLATKHADAATVVAHPSRHLAGQVSTTVPPPLDYHLHLSDRIELQFPFSPDYNETVMVQPDGRISLREVDPIEVAGKTVLEVQSLIQQVYNGIFMSRVSP